MTKGPSSLLRGGIPAGPNSNRKSIKQPASKVGDMGRNSLDSGMKKQDATKNNFYSVDELFELLDLPQPEVAFSRAAAQPIQFRNESTKEGKLLSADSSDIPVSQVSKGNNGSKGIIAMSPASPQNQQYSS